MQVVDWISKQAGKLADKFENYKFYIKSTPDHIDSSTRLFLNAYSSRDQEALVPCTYKWFRIKNGILADVPEFKGNTFLCEPSDVGSTLQAEVTSIDEQYPGIAILKFGPVQIDVLLKQTIESALSTGEAKFPVDIGHADRTKQCSLLITDDFMRIAHCNSNSHFKFYYCLGEPLINALPKDPANISLVFPQKYQNETIKFLSELWTDMSLSKDFRSNEQLTLNIKFINRRSKDEFLFVMKGFIAKKELKNSTAIKKIQKLDIDNSNIHFMLQIQSLRRDLLRLFNLNKRAQQQKRVYMDETLKLQKEIEDIISSYTKLIEGKFKTRQQFQESFIQFENKKDNAITHKNQRLQEQNARLKEYIRQKIEGDKDTYINVLREEEGRIDFTSNPFNKKKEPFAQISAKKQNEGEYEKVLDNLYAQEDVGEINATDMMAKNKKLEQKLTKSIMKVQRLEGEIDRINRSAFIGANDPNNLSMSRQSSSALDISTSKVVDEKVILEKKYAKLKEDYSKLKNAYQLLKASNSVNVQASEISNNMSTQEKSSDIMRMKSAMAAMEREKQSWKEKAESLASELRKEREQNQRTVQKLQKKMNDMKMEIQMNRKSTDALNRSQHLSMEMDEYNSQQLQILKEQNAFLMNENQRLTKMCEKYKSQYKKMKENFKVTEADSLLL